MSGESFHALAFSTDRQLLRRLTRLLELVGCRVDQLTHVDRAPALVSATRPDFVLVDGDLPSDKLKAICLAAASDQDAGPPPIVLALVATQDAAQVSAVLARGVDDVLQKPLA